jgi:hypothetical protein
MYLEHSTLHTAAPVQVSTNLAHAALHVLTYSTTVGPLVGGQIYARVNNGWTVLMGLSAGMGVLAAVAAAFGAGDEPLATRLAGRRSRPTPPTPTGVTRWDATQQQQDPVSTSAIRMEKVVPPLSPTEV